MKQRRESKKVTKEKTFFTRRNVGTTVRTDVSLAEDRELLVKFKQLNIELHGVYDPYLGTYSEKEKRNISALKKEGSGL